FQVVFAYTKYFSANFNVSVAGCSSYFHEAMYDGCPETGWRGWVGGLVTENLGYISKSLTDHVYSYTLSKWYGHICIATAFCYTIQFYGCISRVNFHAHLPVF